MRFRYEFDGAVHEIDLARQGETYQASVDGTPYTVEVLSNRPGELTLRLDGRPVRIYWANTSEQRWLSVDGCTYCLEKPRSLARRRAETQAEQRLRAPMPAQVRLIEVEPGQAVEAGQTLLVLEAMKMEIRLTATRPAVIKSVPVQVGETVAKDQLLIELE